MRTEGLPTVSDMNPAAHRCWERIAAVLPPSDPSDPADPSVNLATLMAILHAALYAKTVLNGPWFMPLPIPPL